MAQAPHPLDAAAGKALFERQWVAAPASTAASDGLGPLYNARACAACHPGGGSSDQEEHRILRINDPVYGLQLQIRALAGMQPEGRLLLHDASPAETGGLSELLVVPEALAHGSLSAHWSLRMPPALFAVAAIDAVSEEAVREGADPSDHDGDGISGRLALLPDAAGTQVGRFGWKAESPTLEHQVARAFSLDLGLGSAWFPSAFGDCTAAQEECLRGVEGSTTGSSAFELENAVIELVATWLRTLQDSDMPPDAESHVRFSSLGCAACHVPLLDGQRLFSDLLLHDMGAGLADSLPLAHAESSEWRTAPLVGLGSKQRFLHDGRAGSVREAILWHGGEAEAARAAWMALPRTEQQGLDAFLKQL